MVVILGTSAHPSGQASRDVTGNIARNLLNLHITFP